MVADALVYHPSVAHYLRYIATTVGRDKLLRTLQYFSRFYAWYLLRTNRPQSQIQPFEAMKKQFGLGRKMMRVGKNIEHFKAAAVAVDSKVADPVLKYCAVGRQLGYALYLSFDAIAYLDAAGIRPSQAAKWLQQEAYRAWFFGLFCSTLSGVYTLYQLRIKGQAIDKKTTEDVVESKRLERERSATNIQLLSDLCDMTIPSTALGWANFDDGFVGLAGTISSIIGVLAVWKKTA
ncbi:MAG: Peroxisomal membrane protein PMP27 [Trizodia sp. TS-e1964]|nr:MAG: Peroxisomal membrane protein PMP27 [Trizodia sp. TS-e1964]